MLRPKFLGPSEVLDEIVRFLGRPGVRFQIAVAYLKNSGLDRIKTALMRANGRLVAGTSSFHITDWQALKMLVRLSKTNPRLLIRKYYHESFHPKVFYFEDSRIATAIVGSSNLTGGGLEKNVEANVMVQGPVNDGFFIAVRAFLDRVYDGGEILDDRFVKQYRGEVRRFPPLARKSGKTLPRTSLPKRTRQTEWISSINIPAGAKWWKVAPGKDGEDWPLWKEHIDSNGQGYVSIGWANVGNLKPTLGWPEEKFCSYVESRIRSSRPGYVSGQFWSFARLMRPHDLVAAYSERTIFGIAQIEGSYRFRPDIDKWYPHLRPVKWLAIPGTKPPRNIMRMIATNDTVHEIEDQVIVRYLRTLLGK